MLFLMMVSSVGFAADGDNGDYDSCQLGCKFFYQVCKDMNDRLGMNDNTCEETMTSCNRMCYSMYYSER